MNELSLSHSCRPGGTQEMCSTGSWLVIAGGMLSGEAPRTVSPPSWIQDFLSGSPPLWTPWRSLAGGWVGHHMFVGSCGSASRSHLATEPWEPGFRAERVACGVLWLPCSEWC